MVPRVMQQFIEGIGPWAYDAPIAAWIRTTRWGVPTLSVLHVFGLILLLGSAFMLTLRCFGLAWRRDEVHSIVRTLAASTLGGLALMTVSGSLIFASGADRYALSNTFQFKMTAYALAIVVQSTVYVAAARDKGTAPRIVTPSWIALGTLAFLCWLAVGIAGRFIAFY